MTTIFACESKRKWIKLFEWVRRIGMVHRLFRNNCKLTSSLSRKSNNKKKHVHAPHEKQLLNLCSVHKNRRNWTIQIEWTNNSHKEQDHDLFCTCVLLYIFFLCSFSYNVELPYLYFVLIITHLLVPLSPIQSSYSCANQQHENTASAHLHLDSLVCVLIASI